MTRKNKIVLVSLGVLLAVAGLLGLLGKRVTIVDGEDTIKIFCFERTVAEVLDKRDIVLEDGDIVVPEPGTPLMDELEISIKRAVPVSIVADGEVKPVRTAADTVAGALSGRASN